ncbi:glycosyltransferase [Lysinibacillus sp. FSL M8-0216]|uniref:Glycosyltransferase involved in cell wall bisynthesis n=1 Tax=Lysinibacillus fusiformis TaxID=28031 RepID=A0A1H9CWM6_9BACI|nr:MULTISPECIES: glycosyltransferase [Lysinibacillus]EAZ84765.1 predicted glycosyltransferase [Bacillus sp. B14905]MCG7434309.1 glycosyltransferase [Lysinibacillus fusiformis]MED4074930.1 glycosyltransferase [Lysinibacillus fusiformis]MED4668745.1 glycosyltransferase [Lysinibacillus fusiformis]NOG27446.1 glycosyltransferase [Lysinibacillus fusiformis]
MVLVSVIVPVYNAENYLNKCLTSICHQSLKDIEIITINDGSEDQSLTVLQNFAQVDARITVLDTDNGGVSKARNLGMEQAKGQYITFVDADDWLELTMLEELFLACRLTGSNIVKCDLFWQEEIGSRQLYYPSKTYFTYSATACLNKLFTEIGEKHFGFASCKLYKKSFIDLHKLKFDETMNFAEDTVFLTRAVIKNQSICYVPKQLYYYNVGNQNSLTSRAMSNVRNNYDLLYKKLSEELQSGEVYEKVKNSFLNYQFEGLLVILHQCPAKPQAIKNALQSFLQAYPEVLKVKLMNRKLQQFIFLKLIKMNWLTLSSTLIYMKVKRAK